MRAPTKESHHDNFQLITISVEATDVIYSSFIILKTNMVVSHLSKYF